MTKDEKIEKIYALSAKRGKRVSVEQYLVGPMGEPSLQGTMTKVRFWSAKWGWSASLTIDQALNILKK